MSPVEYDTPLTMKDLNKLTKKYAADWYDIGIELGLDIGVLDSIEEDYKKSERCFQKVLAKWLKFNPNPTWKALDDILTGKQQITDTIGMMLLILCDWVIYTRHPVIGKCIVLINLVQITDEC